jgi:NAD(P)-dependent dehydrogenase (short-subunit alcohol dehydrogenase family)
VELAGRAALVTGGSGDLGTAICLGLARRKVDVAVAYVEQRERAESVAADVEGLG